MAVQKNFVVKNGLEVNGALISADALVDKVGIGTGVFDSLSKLTVDGSVKAENLYLESGSGIGSIYNAKGTILEYENGYINVGVVTSLTGTAVTYTTGNITNLSGSGDIDYSTGTITTLDGSSATFGTVDAVTNLYVGGALFDNNDLDGDPDQVLTSTGTGVTWKAVPSSPWSSSGSDLYYISGNVGVGTDVPNGAADPNNTTILNAGIVTANFYYGNGSNLIDISNLASDIDINTTGIITASTFYGDGSNLSGLPQQGIGIRTEGGDVGFGITFLDLRGAGVSTSYYSSGITTIFFEGGGSGTIGFGTEFPDNSEAGDLFYNAEYGRTFVYYDETIVGSGTSQFWVDASPFNDDVSTNNVFLPGSTTSPSWYIEGDSATGVYSPSFGSLTFLSNGTEILNTNPSGIEVITGIATFSQIESIQTGGSNVIPLYISADTDANTPALKIEQSGNGAAILIDDDNGDTTPFIITESGNTGIGTTNPTEKLDVLGTVKAVDFNSTSDVNLKENITTVDNALDLTNQLRGVRFEWKRDGKPSYGVIAQELETVLPELVTQGDPKTVNYNGIIGVLIEAVKELSAEVEQLKNK